MSKELSLKEVVEKYPEIPKLIILKIDAQRRGVHYTDSALTALDENVHQLRGPSLFGSRDSKFSPLPDSLILRDGTTVLTDPTPIEQNPYIVDLVDEKLVLKDKEEILEEVEFWRKPKYYDKKTSTGIQMNHIVSARPQRLNITYSGYCHFWDNDHGCKYCDIVNNLKQQKDKFGIKAKLRFSDVSETVKEALKEEGRFSTICLTSGSNTRGREPFDEEVDEYIELLQAIGENFKTKKFPSQLIGTAFNEKQLTRLYEKTGLLGYTSDLEVLNEELFTWICAGKAEWIGYKEWKARLIRAVDIFGRGNVNSGIVGGVELAKPKGFTNEDDALKSTLEEAEDLAQHGVSVVHTIWVPRPGSYFKDQKNASLEYYVRLTKGLHNLRKKYQLSTDSDDYRRCGNHADSDLARIL